MNRHIPFPRDRIVDGALVAFELPAHITLQVYDLARHLALVYHIASSTRLSEDDDLIEAKRLLGEPLDGARVAGNDARCPGGWRATSSVE
jgi:hypothetical protein